jgi:hypothetical protein
MSPGAEPAPHDPKVFKPDPRYGDKPYDAAKQIEIYGGKRNIDEPRPIIELGRPLYLEGPLAGGFNVIGRKNLVAPSLQVFGDWRNAVAYNDNGRVETAVAATRLNLDVDLQLTSTERIHALFRPLDQNGQFTRHEFAGDKGSKGKFILDGNVDTLFAEGDFGNILAGLTDEYSSFDLPFAAGLMPLIFQNGVWADDAITGFAFAIPARNSRRLGISNIEANEGYWEVGIGHIDGEGNFGELSFTSATVAFTRRYGGWLSNSVRGVWTFGQERNGNRQQTADGFILLVENSLITAKPLTLVPYANLFAGLDRPQSLIRDAGAGGILKNTGILFETDGLTGFPKLDDSGQNTYGGAVGVQYLFNLDQQIVVEAASVRVFEGDLEPGRPARGAQYGVGARYQLPLNRWLILRADAIHAWRDRDDDLSGVRSEIRAKF